MSEPYVLQRLSERVWWVQAFNYGTVFHVGDAGVLIFDTLEGVYDNITQAVASVTDKPITAAIYPHYHADHIGDIDQYVAAAGKAGKSLRIIGSEKSRQAMELSNSGFPLITDVVDWPHGRLATLRERLHQERRFRLQQIQQLTDSVPTTPQDARGSQALGAHIQVHVELTVSARLVLAEVKAALRRMDQGRYGSCHGCGSSIALPRLQVIPQTRRCTLCHWIEETRR